MKKIINCLAVLLISLNSFAQEADLFRKDGHKSELVSISMSPDNKYIISVEKDTLAIIWDITTGQQVRTIKNVESAVFRDNTSIYLAMNDKTFKLVDLLGQTISVFGSKGAKYQFSSYTYGDIKKLFFPETGIYLFGDDVFDMDKGYQRRLEVGPRRNTHTDYCPLTMQLAVADNETGKITLIDVASGKPVGTVQTNNLKDENMLVTYSPNGKKLLVTRNSVFLVIDIDSRKIQWTIKKIDTAHAREGIFSPDGETVALHDEGNRIERLTVLDIESGKTLFVKNFKEFMFPVKMKFSPDGEQLAFWVQEYDDTESLYLLDAKKGTTIWRYSQDNLSTAVHGSSMLFSANGQKLVFGNSTNLLLLNTSTGLKVKNFAETSQGRVSQLYFINGNSRMVSNTRDYVFSWNLQTGEMERALFLKERKFEYRDKEYTPLTDGKKYFVIQEGNLIEIDTAGRKTFQFTSTKKLENRFNVKASFDGQFVVNQGYPLTGGCTTYKNANTLEVYDSKTHKLVYSNACVMGMASFFNTQNILVCQEKSETHPLRFYEMPSGKLLYEIKPPNRLATQYEKLTFSENDRYLTIGENNESGRTTIKLLIDLTTKQIRSIPVTNPNAISKGNIVASLKAIGFKGEKYIVYDVNSNGRIMFYNIEADRFDDQMTIKYPAGISGLSAKAISPNGKFLFIGTYTGTIMLWNIEQKKFQGTLYPDASKRNWAVIAPQGQFDGNAGAQNDMFHVTGNTVVPLNSMYEKFWTPRLLPRILEGEQFGPSTVDVKKLKKAPVVKIQFKENTRNLEVDDDEAIQTIETKFGNASVAITAECPLDAVTEIRLYQNGKLVETTRNLTVEDENQGDKTLAKTFQVNLLEGTNRFRAIAFNTERTESRPIELSVLFKPERTGPAVNSVEGIQLHVLVIGINVYKNPKYNLNYAEADAFAFKLAIENGSKGIFSKVNSYYIKDDKASKAGIVAELEKVKAIAKPEDVFIFYYAGHGVVNDKKEFFLVPYDVTQLYGNDEALGQKGLSAASLQQFSKDIKAQKQLYILDACQSAGALDNIVASRGAAEEKAIAQLARSTGTHWLTASGSNQFASEFSKLGHGAFTYCLLEAFKGITDNGDKKITVKELDAFLQNKVPEITRQYQGAAQYPASYGYGNDFPVILLK